MPTPGSSIDSAKLIRRSLFFVLLIGLAIVSIFLTFGGLTSPRGMEQAQVGREISRGNGYTTKVVRVAAIAQLRKANDGNYQPLQGMRETYHAPLSPFIYAAVIKLAGGDDAERWKMSSKTNIFQLDRVIAATCMVFFLMSIGVNYLLVSRIFDQTIGAVTAILMLFCELMWQLTHTGLPQMLMLLLFSCAMFFVWRAVENQEENRPALGAIIASAVFLALLVLTHWLAFWIYLGYTVFAAAYFKPRGVIAALLIGVLLLVTLPVAYMLYYVPTDSMLGTAFYAIYNGLGMSEDSIMRSLEPQNEELAIRGLMLNILRTTLLQITDLLSNFGNILVAPLFFLALLHPFKRSSLANFRWALLMMWICAALGMSIYGIRKATDPNQIHILFAPLMAAYGLAMVSILWSRLNLPQSMHALRHAHLIIIVMISAGPMMLSLPQEITQGIRADKQGGLMEWPPYFPQVYNRTLAENTKENEIIISDTPWAVAWYADRTSVWLPQDVEGIQIIDDVASEQRTPIAGIAISPYSFNSGPIYNIARPGGTYADLYPLVFDAWGKFGVNQGGFSYFKVNPRTKALADTFEHQFPLVSPGWLMYYSKRQVVPSKD